jgi:hypothetical protein
MRTRLMRGKFWLLFMTLGMLLAVAEVALADVIVNTLDDSIENQREIVNLESHGKSATVQIY